MTAAANPASSPVTTGGQSGVRLARSRRNSELWLLLLAMVLVAAYQATIEATLLDTITADFWIPAAALGAVFLGLHLVIRFLAPFADPALLPAVALLNGIGVGYLRRIDLDNAAPAQRDDLAIFAGIGGRQLAWTLISVLLAAGLLALVRDHRSVSRYAYTLGLAGIVLVLIPAVLPASMSEINGAKLWIRIGSFSIQPGEFAKLALLVFFAYYLVRKREVLSLASRRFLGVDFPRGRDLGPVLVVWAVSLMVLIFQKDLGTSLLYFGMFVVTLYIATERVSWLIIGLLLFSVGAYLAYFLGSTVGGPFANFYVRAEIWLDPFADPTDKGYQLVQGLLALGTGGLFGAGPGGGEPGILPEVENDFIFAGIGEEIGLFGLSALLVVYLLIVVRGLRAALEVRDSFGKLVAGGLSFTLGLQVFVIVGGISGLIPLTGQTTPFLSAGGSSLMANWLLIAVLLRVSDAARRPVVTGGGPSARPGGGPPEQLHGAKTEVIRP
ncbi:MULTISPECIES: FtsW/RodA/SpoVE family cell cycle protein [Micromonospora]|uniref:Cell elongation-specific peptidoglycan biosynthesis regulator RodA n=1 Tax=Micromonospora yangpuensis TaxID=683228 RepID=A0A1C6TXK4_9ACTN|nr:FtsW/RodA/SpoVE family cell cycle protein [Micromonospora yangpuensis]GGM01773.1 cell division protein FtsW [Micromonospora yangpuensis]SCL46341.1 cell elongation-specific peptidoglycan biosynthesis regulator RodA [Micromonospora yangpuensis]